MTQVTITTKMTKAEATANYLLNNPKALARFIETVDTETDKLQARIAELEKAKAELEARLNVS